MVTIQTHRHATRVCLSLLILSWTLLCAGITNAAELNARIDRTQLSQSEYIRFTLELLNSDTRLRAEGVKPNVDLTLLTDNFTLGTPVADNRYNIYEGRGRSTSSITVDLFPTRSGTFSIPPFSVDGMSTQAIQVTVLPESQSIADEVFVRGGTDKANYWVNEQIVTYVDLYHRVALQSASFGDNLETEPTRIELMQHWKLEQATRKEIVNGIEYDVQRVAWALFPSEAGPLTIQLPDVWVTTEAGRKLRLSHQRLELTTKALPKDIPKNIIIGKPHVSQTRLPTHGEQYKLTHWSISVSAPIGVVTLPKYLPGINVPDGLKLYADAARRDSAFLNTGVVDKADYILSIMPMEAGEFTIPAIRIPYFDPDKGVADFIETDAQTITVNEGTLPQPELTIDTTISPPQFSPTSETSYVWQTLTTLFACLWIVTLALLIRSRTPRATIGTNEVPQEIKHPDVRHPLQLKLLNAMKAQTLEEGLNRWQESQPEDTSVATAVKALQSFCYQQNNCTSETVIKEKVDQALETLATRKAPITTQSSKWQPETFARR